jgi:hypothetical protein
MEGIFRGPMFGGQNQKGRVLMLGRLSVTEWGIGGIV